MSNTEEKENEVMESWIEEQRKLGYWNKRDDEIRSWNIQFREYIKRSNEYYNIKFDFYKKLENDGLLTLNEEREVILNFKDANPHQQWMMRRYKENQQYYDQMQVLLKEING